MDGYTRASGSYPYAFVADAIVLVHGCTEFSDTVQPIRSLELSVFPISLLLYVVPTSKFICLLVRPDHSRLSSGDYVGQHLCVLPDHHGIGDNPDQ
jgi:hypothetical protein